ncbi:probable LIM domain-containing serine/threonine-protein kinase DDB_G0287001 [Actinia tenebrosa]|uniref:Probable LIM domain-containing serine/threonine-protein kinase DDB_G0287001 n=1 Tax=Actinia tenebrosa TaxID=6105 RepID=A0A6P8HMW6_ACTTE|nr:probable LIM domain-containing serine/threonine-protein kinase DDB_G0287001 [Actinia tenebrosa]
MASRKSPDIPFAGEPDTGLDETQRKKSVLITNVPPGTKEEDLIIYFQKESNGGGEVEDAKMLEDGKALVIFDEEEVANRVLEREHTLNGNLLQLEPCFKFTDDMEVFSLVSAKLDTSRFTVDLKELNELLVKAQEETGVNFLKTCEGFFLSGTLEQIEKTCLFLSRYVKSATPVTESSDNLQNVHRNDHPLGDSDDEENDLKTLVLDVEPKLLQILQIKVNEIEKKFKMKIDWKSEPYKANLSPNGKDARLFEQGKEEFITLYQKEFPDLQEKDFPLDAGKNIEDIDSTVKALMEEFAVVIERKDDKNVHIFGKENDVAQVMQQLQGKFGKRRGRKPYKASSNGELPMADTYAHARTLETERQAHQTTNQRKDALQRTLETERQAHQETSQRKEEIEVSLEEERQRIDELLATQATLQRSVEDYRASTESCDWVLARDEIMMTENLIGKGAWGSVTEGKFRGCEVAVKQIHQLILSDHNRRLFEREIGIASRCRHPCLLQFIGATNDNQSPLFVTELLDSSLRALLHERALNPTEIITIALDVAKGLNYLHLIRPTPIIHRDISSANVLLWKHNTYWRAKVSDFGTANFLHQSMTVGPGAPVYSAPESFTSTQTPKVDVYSFGVLLCEMFVRDFPDVARRNEQIAMVSNELFRRLIRKCLQQDPNSRPSMAEILEELKSYQN